MRHGTGRVGVRATVLIVAVGFVSSGCGGAPPVQRPTGPEVGAEATAEVSAEALLGPAPSTPAASPSPSRSAASRSSPSAHRAPTPRARPKPPTEKTLPPSPPAPAADCTPSYRGTKATLSQVRDALTAAAGRTYWPSSAPGLRVPVNLVKAVAWQESGWQSNIIACDGGVGLMQVMEPTADFVNQRFEQSYDVEEYRDNATLGANYLAWLTRYIGDAYFDSDYSLDAANCTAELNSCVLNAVIAAYNFGPGAVATDSGLVIPNPRYVQNVRALMTECTCLSV